MKLKRTEPPDKLTTSAVEETNAALQALSIGLDVIRDSSDVFPPLKSAIGFLSAIIHIAEVRHVHRVICIVSTIANASDAEYQGE